MRRLAAGFMAVGVVVAGCTTTPPPPSQDSNPFACAAEPVDLGAAGNVEAMSLDGKVIVVRTGDADGRMVYDVIDRRAGERHTMKMTDPAGDGAAILMNDAGTLIYGFQYLASGSDKSPWFAYDVATRSTTSFEPAVAGEGPVGTFSSDLSQFVVQKTASAGSAPVGWELVDFPSGATTPLGVTTDPGWRTAGFSPDLSLVVQYSAASSFSKSLRVLDTASGAVARDVGRLANESSFYIATRFVDNRTLLVNDAVPFGSPPDGISTDGAFLVDIPSGAITRIDPGVADASTSQATPDGRRSMFFSARPGKTWVRIDGQNRLVIETSGSKANSDVSVVVTADNGRAMLQCL